MAPKQRTKTAKGKSRERPGPTPRPPRTSVAKLLWAYADKRGMSRMDVVEACKRRKFKLHRSTVEFLFRGEYPHPTKGWQPYIGFRAQRKNQKPAIFMLQQVLKIPDEELKQAIIKDLGWK